LFKAAMPKASVEKPIGEVIITSTPETEKGFDDEFWKDLLK
jgi:hypothetical protein